MYGLTEKGKTRYLGLNTGTGRVFDSDKDRFDYDVLYCVASGENLLKRALLIGRGYLGGKAFDSFQSRVFDLEEQGYIKG